ncbi:MAG: sulfatase-like hydrolase/transferase [Bacilli bacterium]|nr:sulfatase-like hydrolase/transferase [Bacilli bacterium]
MKKTIKNNKQKEHKILNKLNKVAENPGKFILDVFKKLGKSFSENIVFVMFVFLNVLNAFVLRMLTMNNPSNFFAFQPLLADFAFVLIIGSFGFLFKKLGRTIYYFIVTIILTAICVINSSYYTFYTSFTSISLISTLKFIGQVGDAVVENVMKPKDFVYILAPIIMLAICIKKLKSNVMTRSDYKDKPRALKTLAVGVACAVVFVATLTSTDIGRFVKQWNREYIVMKYGIYVYHVNDLIKSVEPKITSLFGYDEAMKTFKEYFGEETEQKTNKYTGIYEGKNIIAIHAESIQSFVIGLQFNGVEVTPNLNKLVNSGLYFDNFYSQVSVGTSSDSEFTFSTSLMPSNTGTAFGSYYDRTYITTQKLLKEKGYYTFSMHGNNADYWNRRIMYESIGYDEFYAKDDYDIDEVIGLGISDKSFFRQSVDKIKKINEENEKFYGTIIMLTNHTPFSDTEKYGEFDVSLHETVYNEITGTYEEVIYPYLEGTKLGNYLKSVHYADAAIGEFITALDEAGILEDTVVVVYGDHDARLPKADYQKMYNYDKNTDGILPDDTLGYIKFDSYQYELNRKVPFIIWTKDGKYQGVNSNVMGMYDVQPTLGNMFGFSNPYSLGNDIFNIGEENIVVFPTGNWVTNKVYYNSQKNAFLTLKDTVITDEYIVQCNDYSDKLLNASNAVIVYDLIKKSSEEQANESQVIEDSTK